MAELPLTATLTTAEAAAGSTSTLPEIGFEKYTLDNGLEVILHEDHATPAVAVDVWYHVGSKNERVGRTGFAHLFEHMMFQGSKHWDADFFRPLQEAGGSLNGSTNTDRTNYWEIVPPNFVELALWLEADRMGFLLDAMTQTKLDNQRDVVKNERRQNYENRPYGMARGIIAEAAYPPGHPYSWLTIGSAEDLNAASLDDVKGFYRDFYNPSNATLVVAGDIDPARIREFVLKHFGGLVPGPPVRRHAWWVPRFDGPRRIIAQDRVQLPRLYLVWHSTPFYAPDDASLDVLAGVLGAGKSSRLYQRLVYDRQIAQDVSVMQSSGEIAGTFQVIATARAGHTLLELEQAIDLEIARLVVEGPTAEETARVKNRIEADFIKSMQQIGGFGGIADRLNQYNHYVAEPDYFAKDLARYQVVTTADVARVLGSYLGTHRLALEIQPMAKLRPSNDPVATSVDRTQKPSGGTDPECTLPRIERRRLSNGLELVVAEQHRLPLIELHLVGRAGAATDPNDVPGLASLVAAMLDEGTPLRSSLDIARHLDDVGADLRLSVDADASYASLSTLTKHADRALEVFADVVTRPTFPPDELERIRTRKLTRLAQEADQPQVIASRAVLYAIYGTEHPYAVPEMGTIEGVRAVTRERLVEFYEQRWRPRNITAIVVGDITVDGAVAQLERAFSGWADRAVDTLPVPDRTPLTTRALYLIDRPGMTQSVVNIASVGRRRDAPDFFSTAVMNAALGGMFSSRLNLNLREDKGYTYGARSSFDFRKSAGPFVVAASVETRFTAATVREMMKELGDIRGARPLTVAELDFAKSSIVRGFPRSFETPGQIADRLSEMVLHGLPDDYFGQFVALVNAVTPETANRAANLHLDPDRVAIVIVGDAVKIQQELEDLQLGELVMMGTDARPLP